MTGSVPEKSASRAPVGTEPVRSCASSKSFSAAGAERGPLLVRNPRLLLPLLRDGPDAARQFERVPMVPDIRNVPEARADHLEQICFAFATDTVSSCRSVWSEATVTHIFPTSSRARKTSISPEGPVADHRNFLRAGNEIRRHPIHARNHRRHGNAADRAQFLDVRPNRRLIPSANPPRRMRRTTGSRIPCFRLNAIPQNRSSLRVERPSSRSKPPRRNRHAAPRFPLSGRPSCAVHLHIDNPSHQPLARSHPDARPSPRATPYGACAARTRRSARALFVTIAYRRSSCPIARMPSHTMSSLRVFHIRDRRELCSSSKKTA